jgi:hypothetical protein
MPIHQFKCAEGHITEKVFLTFGAAEGVAKIPCEFNKAPHPKL